MTLTPEEVASLIAQSQEQAGEPVITETKQVVTTIKEGEVIEPKVEEYKTPEQLREEAIQLALDNEKEQHIISLEAKLIEDLSLSPEERLEIETELKGLKVEDTPENLEETETPEQTIARLQKELEEAKIGKKDINPLAEVENKAKEAGVNIPEFYKEYVENGELSSESLKSLLDAGFDQTAIDAYIFTKVAQGEKEAETIISQTVGTRETYNKMADWMRASLTPEQIAEYDAGVNSPHAKIYIENMYTKYTTATVQPVIIRNQGNITTSSQSIGFKSLNEQAMAIADARYGKDIKYTDEVRRKIQISTY